MRSSSSLLACLLVAVGPGSAQRAVDEHWRPHIDVRRPLPRDVSPHWAVASSDTSGYASSSTVLPTGSKPCPNSTASSLSPPLYPTSETSQSPVPEPYSTVESRTWTVYTTLPCSETSGESPTTYAPHPSVYTTPLPPYPSAYTTPLPPYPTNTQPYPTSPAPSSSQCAYWLADIKHQGIAAFNPDPATYQVFRNVQDFGAKGDGVTDDTAAIQLAISSGDRCGPGTCNSSTTTPAVVYFPEGTYLISSSIIDYYYTQLIGNPNCLPIIKASPNFTVSADPYLIDGDPSNAAGDLEFGATNIFWRQIRNFVLDLTSVPAHKPAVGVHWPTGQATSLMNVYFEMSQAKGTQQQGIVIIQGSGGFMSDLTFNGGKNGVYFNNQQFTMRNFTFNNVETAIYQDFNWGWVYQGITINNSSIGVNLYSGGPTAALVGSLTFIDSEINDTPIGFYTPRTTNTTPPTAGSLILENVQLNNVPVAVMGGNNETALAGSTGSLLIAGWGEGHEYTPDGPTTFEGPITPVARPASLITADGDYYTESKPQYQQYPVSSFISARDEGATGNGHTDDTAALQNAILAAVQQDKILFVDQGDYLVTSTIYIPAGSRIVGESYSVILSSGSFFNNMSNPQPVVQIGKPGEVGSIEWSDMIVSTQGMQQGAILFEYNMVASSADPAGLWDVHARVGGFAGSDLLLAHCPTTPNKTVTAANLARHCIAGFMTMHVTPGSAGLYLENVWLWTADHDVEAPLETQLTIYNGRGLLIENTDGPLWLWGTAVEHHTKYQYQFVNAANVFAGFIQTETPYYQPNPSAPLPFPYVAGLSDPHFPTRDVHVGNLTIPDADAWGLRLINASAVNIYGAGHYSFFDNYSTACSDEGAGETCQARIVEVLGDSQSCTIYNLNTVGTHYMLTVDGVNVATYSDNLDGFIDTIALSRNL